MSTHELEGSTLRLLLTTELEADDVREIVWVSEERCTYCLQRFKGSCILYLQEVHSSRSTTFLVVFACYHRSWSETSFSYEIELRTFLWKTGLV